MNLDVQKELGAELSLKDLKFISADKFQPSQLKTTGHIIEASSVCRDERTQCDKSKYEQTLLGNTP